MAPEMCSKQIDVELSGGKSPASNSRGFPNPTIQHSKRDTDAADLSFLENIRRNIPTPTAIDDAMKEAQSQAYKVASSLASVYNPTADQNVPHDSISADSLPSESGNQDIMTQLEALEYAQAWFDGARKRLSKRAKLAQDMSEGLEKLLNLLYQRREVSRWASTPVHLKDEAVEIYPESHGIEAEGTPSAPGPMPLKSDQISQTDQIRARAAKFEAQNAEIIAATASPGYLANKN